MNSSTVTWWLLIAASGMGVGMRAVATEVWTGPTIVFSMASGADWTKSTNQDHITAKVRLTRAMTRGIFNAVTESGYTSFFSPDDTEWAYGDLTNHASLTYTDWEDWNGHNPPSMVGEAAVLHLISDDIYMAIKFTSWGGSAGGFWYARSTPAAVQPPVLLDTRLVGTNFEFAFMSVAGLSYTIESRTNLTQGNWTVRTNVTGDGFSKTVQIPVNPSGTEFFHLVAQ